jgi:hypothetical protein
MRPAALALETVRAWIVWLTEEERKSKATFHLFAPPLPLPAACERRRKRRGACRGVRKRRLPTRSAGGRVAGVPTPKLTRHVKGLLKTPLGVVLLPTAPGGGDADRHAGLVADGRHIAAQLTQKGVVIERAC